MVTSAALTCSSPVGCLLGGRWAHRNHGMLPSLSESTDLTDLIQGDLTSVKSTPLWVCLVSSCRGKWSSCGHTVRLCFGKQAMDATLFWLTRPLYVSCYFLCLSLPFFHIHTTHCKVCLWCLSALSLEWLHNTLESTHQTLVLWVWVDHISTLFDHQRGSSVQADTFYAVRKLCRSAVCQYATTKVDDI